MWKKNAEDWRSEVKGKVDMEGKKENLVVVLFLDSFFTLHHYG